MHNLQNSFKDAISCLRKFLATERPLKIVENALFVLKIFKFLFRVFGDVQKQFD